MKLDKVLKVIIDNQMKISSYGKFNDDILKKINYKFRLDWNYYSNRMEGGTLTREETRSVMVGNIDVKGKPLKDVMEMNGHDKVVLEVLKMGEGEVRISEKRMKEIHKAIMHEEDPDKSEEIGKWKSHPNEIINYKNEKITFTPPGEVAEQVHKLLDRTNAELDKFFAGKQAKHPLEIAAQFHIDLISIHPFFDGNGRTTRILTNILLVACGFPCIIIRDEHKQVYYQLLADIQVYDGSPDLFYAFIGERIIESQNIVLKAIEGKNIDEPDDIDKRVTMLERMLHGVDEEIQKTKNEEVMWEMLKEVVEPLFRKVFEKSLKIAPLFSSTELAYYIDGAGSGHNNIHDLMDDIEISWNQKKGDLEYISLAIRFHKLKKLGTRAVDEFSELKIIFEKHKYQVVIQQDEPIEKLYHQLLPSEQIEEISSRFVNNLLTMIEERIKKIKN